MWIVCDDGTFVNVGQATAICVALLHALPEPTYKVCIDGIEETSWTVTVGSKEHCEAKLAAIQASLSARGELI